MGRIEISNIYDFNYAIEYYLLQLRFYDFVKASKQLEKKFPSISTDVEWYCLNHQYVLRDRSGRIVLNKEKKYVK